MRKHQVTADFVVLNWLVSFVDNSDNCDKFWLKDVVYNSFMNDTDEALTPNIFYRTWTRLAEINAKIHKHMYHTSNKTLVYYMVTSDEVTTLDHTKFPKQPLPKNSNRMNLQPQIPPIIQIEDNSDQIESSDIIDNTTIEIENSSHDNSTSVEPPSNEPSGNPTNIDTPVSSPTLIRDNEFNLTENEMKILMKSWDHTTKSRVTKLYISSSFELDFETVPRPDIRRDGVGTIPVHDAKVADEGTKWHFILQLAKHNYMMIPKREKVYLAEAVGKRESYICGYSKAFSGRTLMRW